MDVSALVVALELDVREFPSFLLVRECYEHLIALMEEGWNGNIAQFVILGTPGIGKTMFAIYILVVLVARGETVVWELRDRRFLVSNDRVAHGLRSCRDFRDVLCKKDVYYLVDTQDLESEPDECFGKIAIFCSPNPVRYKNAKKRVATRTVYAPMWSVDELTFCRPLLFPELSDDLFDRAYLQFGGVPRFVIRDAAAIGHRVLAEMEKAFGRQENIKMLLECVGETDVPDDKTSYKLVHLVAAEDYLSCHLEFASSYVKDKLLSRYEDTVTSSLRAFVGSSRDPTEAQSRGEIFESWGHRCIVRGGTFSLRRLTKKRPRDGAEPATIGWTFDGLKPRR